MVDTVGLVSILFQFAIVVNQKCCVCLFLVDRQVPKSILWM